MKHREIDYFKGILQKGLLEHVFMALSCSPYFPWSLTKDFIGSLSNTFILFLPLSNVGLKSQKLGVGSTLDSGNYPIYLASE